jgi:hypothetical protein
MHSVVETPTYLAKAIRIGMTDEDRERVVDYLSRHPTAGDVIVGTGGARKVRVAGRGRGKSGGYRVFTFFGGEDVPLFLLTVISKGDRANISKAERNALRDELQGVVDDYRKGIRVYVGTRQRTSGRR